MTTRARILVIALFSALALAACGSSSKSSEGSTGTTAPSSSAAASDSKVGCGAKVPEAASTKKQTYKSAPPMTIDVNKTYVAHMDTSCGPIDITLNAKDAPKTVNSFVFLAKNGFYDGLKFHRVVPDFVVQGGDPEGTGSGGPGYELPDEPPKNGYTAKSVAMANAGPGTTGSQFFLVLSDTGAKGLGGPPYLYSDLGQVTKGSDVVTKLGSYGNEAAASGDPSAQGPTSDLYINKVTITES